MRNKIILFYIFLYIVLALGFVENSFSAIIESNHSYIKNANLLDDFIINFTGYGDFRTYYIRFPKIKQSDDTSWNNILNNSSYGNNFSTVVLNVDVQGKVDDQNNYGIVVQVGYNNVYSKENVYYLYYKDFFGRVELGNLLSAVDQLRIGGDNVAVGNGGNLNSDFVKILINSLNNITDNPVRMVFVANEGVLSSQFFGFMARNNEIDAIDKFVYKTKINYYTPEFYGLQAFATYTFDNKLYDTQITKINDGFYYDENGVRYNYQNFDKNRYLNIGDIVSYGVNYVDTFDNLGIGLSYVGEINIKSRLKNSTVRNDLDIKINSNVFGANLNYFGLMFGASYGILKRELNERSYILRIQDPARRPEYNGSTTTYSDYMSDLNVKYKSLAVGYEISNLLLSCNYFTSKSKNDIDPNKYPGLAEIVENFNYDNNYLVYKYDSLTASIEYKLNKSVSVYGEYIKFKFKEERNRVILKGNMYSLGMLIMFY